VGYETILYEIQGATALVTLNRPQVLNALNSQLIHEVSAALDAAEADAAVRVVILKGAGRAFCPGYDLKETAQAPPKGVLEWRKRLAHDVRFTLRVWDLKKPVIAAVHGFVLGGGCDLAMMCDITIAAEGTLFGEPEIRFGSGVVTMIMPWVVGLKKSKELLYTGHDRIDAREAMAMGMVNRVVPADRLEEEALALAREIAQIDAEAIALTKSAINRTFEIAGLKAGIEYNLEIDTQIEAAETPERVEFNRLRKGQGLQAALAWRNARFGDA
jgi:enoyl-CoA hydratase